MDRTKWNGIECGRIEMVTNEINQAKFKAIVHVHWKKKWIIYLEKVSTWLQVLLFTTAVNFISYVMWNVTEKNRLTWCGTVIVKFDEWEKKIWRKCTEKNEI